MKLRETALTSHTAKFPLLPPDGGDLGVAAAIAMFIAKNHRDLNIDDHYEQLCFKRLSSHLQSQPLPHLLQKP